MGLKSKLNKMKSFLFDEEEEKVKPEKIEKKGIKEDFYTKKFEKSNDLFFEDVSEEYKKTEMVRPKKEVKEEFSFPEFDDDDFMVATKKPESIIKKEREEKPKVVLYQGSKRKEETKKFKPTPIISPIYGLLDEEGNTVRESKKDSILINSDVSLDDVRKKAYGFGKKTDDLDDTIKNLSSKTIEEAEKEMKEIELSREKSKKEKEVEKKLKVMLEEDDDDDMILPNVNFKEIDVDSETKSVNTKKAISSDDDEDDEDTKEQDLFNLIDTMYQKGEDED